MNEFERLRTYINDKEPDPRFEKYVFSKIIRNRAARRRRLGIIAVLSAAAVLIIAISISRPTVKPVRPVEHIDSIVTDIEEILFYENESPDDMFDILLPDEVEDNQRTMLPGNTGARMYA